MITMSDRLCPGYHSMAAYHMVKGEILAGSKYTASPI